MRAKMVNNYLTIMSITQFVFLLITQSGIVAEARSKFPSSWSSSSFDLGLQFDGFAQAPAAKPPLVSTRGACKEVVDNYNYKCEEHKVTTKDGFILSMQRIPSALSASSEVASKAKPPVLLQHGVFADGVCFMLIGRKSLAFYLADNGFDVWIANSRGTVYSSKHERLNPSQKEFWDWSLDELIEYDLTSTLNYVHDKTGQKVHYVAHSIGTLIGLNALASDLPATKNMRSASLLGPLGSMNRIFSQFALVAARLYFAEARKYMGLPEFNPLRRAGDELYKLICASPLVDCSVFLLTLTGQNCCLNETGIQNFLTHETQPTSTKLLIHVSQNMRGEGNKRYDYEDKSENVKLYGSTSPPLYEMSKIPKDLPMFFSYGERDAVADFYDVQQLVMSMGRHNTSTDLVQNFQINYAHADFLLATNIVEKVYDPMVSFLKSH